MSSTVDNSKMRRSVVAISRTDGRLRAVELEERGSGFEIIWAKSDQDTSSDWRAFADECGLLRQSVQQQPNDSERAVVAGFDSSGVAFYRLDVPAVGEEEIASIVRLQAESRLPLPADKMELAWRTGHTKNGQLPVTMAAARTDRLKGFIENVRCFLPSSILLDCEAIVEVWARVFGGAEQTAAILSVGARSTQVCLAQGGRLSNSVVLDVGTEDFRTTDTEKQTETEERFAQDMKSVLNMFSVAKQEDLPIIVLSDGDELIEHMVSTLVSAGLDAEALLPGTSAMAGQSLLGQDDVYHYRVPIGLGLMALYERKDAFNVFKQLYKPAKKQEKKHWIYSTRAAITLAAAMILILIAASYAIDIATPRALEKRLEASLSDTDIQELIAKQNLIKVVAQARPDMLSLIKLVNDKGGSGIKLTGFHFKKGQAVSLTGEARNQDDIYRFHEALLEDKSVKNALIPNATPDAKGGKVTFTINFQYKNFSQKKSSR